MGTQRSCKALELGAYAVIIGTAITRPRRLQNGLYRPLINTIAANKIKLSMGL